MGSQHRQWSHAIHADRLLLVEGRDEVNLIEALLKHCVDTSAMIQIIDAGGKDRFPGRIAAISAASRRVPDLLAIGVIRDADDSASGSFDSVCSSMRRVGYDPPPAHGEFSNATPSIGVFIVPDGSRPGAMETLCRQSLRADDAAARCVKDYLRCLQESATMLSRNPDKSFVHAYLAATENPVARVGEAALRGVWDFKSPAFAPLCRFVRQLASTDAAGPRD